MTLFTKARSFARNLFLRRSVESDLNQELHSHLELLIEENILPVKRLQPLAMEANELIAIFTTISKRSKGLA